MAFSKKVFAFFIICLVLVSPFLTVLPQLNIASAVPANFTTTTVAQNFNAPDDFTIAPDGRIFVLEKGGNMKVVQNGTTSVVMTLPVDATSDRGLLGIALDPNFETNGYFYLHYINANPLELRISRFTMVGNAANPSTEVVLFHTTQPLGTEHVGGTVRVGPDGKLWFSIGDNSDTANSQDLTNPFGKILRINMDGTIPSDNPFANVAGDEGAIWAYGLRNPFRFNFLPDGKPIIGDVGGDYWEEIDVGQKGGDYGWPTCEGTCSNSNFINPIYEYPHNGATAAIIGGFVYTGNMFPSSYKNSYFLGDYGQKNIRNLTLDGNDNEVSESMFESSATMVVELEQGPDGSLYYISISTGDLYKVTYAASTQPPTVVASATPTSGSAPLTVAFSSAGSSDPNGASLTYNWQFGDGASSTDPNPTHTYTASGNYTASLVVSNGTQSSTTQTVQISVGTGPTVTINAPSANAKYNAGDTIKYSGDGKDSSGNELPASGYTWTVTQHDGNTSTMVQGPTTGVTSGSFTVPTTGDSSPNVTYQITLTVSDSTGKQAQAYTILTPNTSNITLTSNITGAVLDLDGTAEEAPYTFTGVAGFQRSISVLSPQFVGNSTYYFTSWSDNGSQTHTITTPASATTYTATMSTSSPSPTPTPSPSPTSSPSPTPTPTPSPSPSPSPTNIAPGQTVNVPQFAVVAGDAEANGVPLYNGNPKTGLVVLLENAAQVSANWGATVTYNSDQTSAVTTMQNIASAMMQQGCGGGCSSVTQLRWVSNSQTAYALTPGQSMQLPQYTTVAGDIQINGTNMYDSDPTTGLVETLNQAATVTAPWGATAITNPDAATAQTMANDLGSQMQKYGCSANGCAHVDVLLWPDDKPQGQ